MAETHPNKPRSFTADSPFSLIGIIISMVLGIGIALLVLFFIL